MKSLKTFLDGLHTLAVVLLQHPFEGDVIQDVSVYAPAATSRPMALEPASRTLLPSPERASSFGNHVLGGSACSNRADSETQGHQRHTAWQRQSAALLETSDAASHVTVAAGQSRVIPGAVSIV